MNKKILQNFNLRNVTLLGVMLMILWTVIIATSLVWNTKQEDLHTIDAAKIQARALFTKDVIYRRWNAIRGGVYVPVDEDNQPNPYLDIPDRDVFTTDGVFLTKINPAYMTRQAYKLAKRDFNIYGHITSLKPINPGNIADEWETEALNTFNEGEDEFNSLTNIDGKEYLRLMKPLMVEQACLKCHAKQGYKVGDVRGGITVSVPMTPFRILSKHQKMCFAICHFTFWLIGSIGIFFTTRIINRNEKIRIATEEEQKRLIDELKEAADKIKTLRGLIPICASCKKIRDDKGYWNQLETYIRDHTEAEFSHGLCPDCAEKYSKGP